MAGLASLLQGVPQAVVSDHTLSPQHATSFPCQVNPAKPQVLSFAAISKSAHSQHAVADKMLLVRLDVVDPIGSSKHEAKYLDLGKLLVLRKAQVESRCAHARDLLELKFPTCSQGFQQHVVHDQAGPHSAQANLSIDFHVQQYAVPHPEASCLL